MNCLESNCPCRMSKQLKILAHKMARMVWLQIARFRRYHGMR
jgi:hypothetical protein